MLLRESSRLQGARADLTAISEGAAVPSGVAGGSELIKLVDAAIDDASELPAARDAVTKTLGEDILVDAAGVIANFQRMTRIADATGIPVDAPLALVTGELRKDLGLGSFNSAKNSPPLNVFQRFAGHLMKPLIPMMMKRFQPKTEGRTTEET